MSKGLAAMLAFGFATASYAVPFTITSQLTGDPRFFNPDDIVIDVSIAGDTTSNTVLWTVDLNSPLHPNARLGTFAFNVLGGYQNYSFGGFSPAGWSITSGNNVPGSGGADFLFETNDPSGSSNNVTNATSLTFSMTSLLGNFTTSHFLNAPVDCSSEAILGCGQLGAHVQSLSAQWWQSDSGFAMGNYQGTPTTSVPEPGTLTLFGLGLLGVGFMRRRRQSVC